MTISKFDKPTLRKLRDELQDAVDAVSSANGIKIDVGNARFDDTTVTFKLNCVTIGADGIAETTESKNLTRLYPQYVGKVITLWNGVKGEIVGYSTRSRKYPFQVKGVDGKNYKIGEHSIH